MSFFQLSSINDVRYRPPSPLHHLQRCALAGGSRFGISPRGYGQYRSSAAIVRGCESDVDYAYGCAWPSRHGCGSRQMYRVSISQRAARGTGLAEDDSKDTQTITDSVQVAGPVYARMLKARDLGDNQACRCHADMDHCFDLKSITPELASTLGWPGARGIESQDVKVSAPEDVEPVAEV